MEDTNRAYPTLHFLVRHGNWVAAIVAVSTLILGAVLSIVTETPWAIIVCTFASALIYLILRSYVELVRIIVDMLMPR